jgi:hypothetical protein
MAKNIFGKYSASMMSFLVHISKQNSCENHSTPFNLGHFFTFPLMVENTTVISLKINPPNGYFLSHEDFLRGVYDKTLFIT